MTENFAFIFLIPSLYFLNLLIKKEITFYENLFLTILISLTLYARQQYLFLAVFHILVLLLNNDKKEFIFTIIIYSILSIPGFFVLYTWGAFDDLSQTTTQSGNLDLNNIFLNIPKIFFLGVYHLYFIFIIPLILVNFSKFLKNFFSKKCFKGVFIIILIIKIIFFMISIILQKVGVILLNLVNIF